MRGIGNYYAWECTTIQLLFIQQLIVGHLECIAEGSIDALILVDEIDHFEVDLWIGHQIVPEQDNASDGEASQVNHRKDVGDEAHVVALVHVISHRASTSKGVVGEEDEDAQW